jgi:hypothetical protein
MLTRLRSLEQLMPFATAGELLMQKRQSVCLTTMYHARIRHLPVTAVERVALLFPYSSSY